MIYNFEEVKPSLERLKGPFPILVKDEGLMGKIYNADDLHNVEVIFDVNGVIAEVNGEEIECGGIGIYCFLNCENE